LVALGLLLVAKPADLDEMDSAYRGLPPDLRRTVQSNLTLLTLVEARLGMPDPGPHRDAVAALRRRLEPIGGRE
jgi:hypothetical protein